MKMKIFACIMACILLLTGCMTSEHKESDSLSVVTVIFPQYDFARAVCQGVREPHMIMKPGAEIHGFEPSASDIETIANADVFIYGGGESDVWIDSILETIDNPNLKTVKLMEHCKLLEEGSSHHHHEHEHDQMCQSHSGFDEHVWLLPENAIASIEAICDALCQIDHQNAAAYRKNADEYISEIQLIDSELESLCTDSEQNFIAVGDRFPFLYLAHRLDLEYKSVFSGCSHENDASPSVMIDIIETMKAKGTPVVFYTELSDRKIADTISEETGAKPLLLHSAQSISKEDFASELTYAGIMRQNIKNLKEALR